VADQLNVERVHLLRRKDRLEQVVRPGEWRARREHPESRGDAVDVGVDRQLRPPEGEEQDDRGRLAADPG
jgi:hypothetical protein